MQNTRENYVCDTDMAETGVHSRSNGPNGNRNKILHAVREISRLVSCKKQLPQIYGDCQSKTHCRCYERREAGTKMQ